MMDASMLVPVAEQSQAIDWIWRVMLWVCAFFYVLVVVATLAAVVRGHRRRVEERGAAPGDRGAVVGLVVWTALIASTLTGLATASFLVDRRLWQSETAEALPIRVTGHQWWWEVEYPDPADPSRTFRTANELHLPLDRPARLELQSADVIHSLWIPALHGKRDLIPGRTTSLTVTPRAPGAYRAVCGEFCGLQHAHMAMEVHVEADAAFADWQARQRRPAVVPVDPVARVGADVFLQKGCGHCHSIRGTPAAGQVAPELTHFASRSRLAAGSFPRNRGWVAAWLSDPQQQKPGNHMPVVRLTPQEADALLAYLMQLR
jgi:cytochrome c oxidase subunit 2